MYRVCITQNANGNSCRFHSEISTGGAVCEVAAAFGEDTPEVVAVEGERDRGGKPDIRSGAYAGEDSA